MLFAAALVATAATAPRAEAREEHEEHEERATRAPRTPPPAAWRAECAACHVAYPARALPAASWQRLMDHLPTHFGTDASLDPATTQQVAAWLVANAGPPDRGGTPPEDRITRSAWFVREHREVPAGTWASKAVGRASRCEACHTTASQGVFDEHHVRIPG